MMAGLFCYAQCGRGKHSPHIYLHIGEGGHCHCSGIIWDSAGGLIGMWGTLPLAKTVPGDQE